MSAAVPAGVSMVIFSGGKNSRLEALSGTIYKPFLPLHGISLIARHIFRAALAGVRDITIITDQADPLVARYVDEIRDGVNEATICLRFVDGEPAAKLVNFAADKSPTPPVLVTVGDTYAWYDPAELVAAALAPGIDSAMAVADYHIPFGVVSISDDLVTSFNEKPASGYRVNTGQLALGPQAMRLISEGSSLAGALTALAADAKLAAVEISSAFITVDSIIDIAAAHESDVLNG
jgi:NDP-sugar pyrophosphorylase family protein